MAADHRIARYRRWYARLLRLYPGPMRDRFAEPMAQTFADLCRERAHANRSVLAFVLEAHVETSAQIVREHMTRLSPTRTVARSALITAAVLAVPLLAMVFRLGVPDPGSGTEGVNWSPMDFAIVGVLVFGSGLLYQYGSAPAATSAHRLAVAIAVLAGLALVWINLAVGMIGDEGNPANLMYVLVVAVALIGASIARYHRGEAATAMFATAAAHVVVVVVALVAGLGPTLVADGFFVAAWTASALLLRQANAGAPAG
jgi:hypothetical protein